MLPAPMKGTGGRLRGQLSVTTRRELIDTVAARYRARLMISRLYAWKSAKWVRGLELLASDQAKFWERNGYDMRGDPWAEERYG